MTIKEVEEQTGMSRANIRFYEAEGLVCPGRDPNGYRNYSPEDLETLRKIRLLRCLRVGIDEIRAVIRGERRLQDVLAAHAGSLASEEEELIYCRKVCEKICQEQSGYESLDPELYMELLHSGTGSISAELEKDEIPRVAAPWQRFFARSLDLGVYSLLWNVFLSLVLHINTRHFSVAACVSGILAQIMLMLLLEPVMLSLFGTTPGKRVFGIRVTGPEDGRLSWRAAFVRTVQVIGKGYGFFIPFYELVCLYRSCRACREGEMLEWEKDSTLVQEPQRRGLWKKGLLYAALTAAFAVIGFFAWQAGSLPGNRGDLTVARFCENYNEMQEFYGITRPVNVPDTYTYDHISYPLLLDENGKWQEYPGISQSFGGNFPELPELEFTEEEGRLTGVSFSLSWENENITATSYGDFMALAAVSFICAREDYSLASTPPGEIYRQITQMASRYSGFTYSAAGVKIECSVEHTGYTWTGEGDVLKPEYGEETAFKMEFFMREESGKV